ncbi:MAG: ribose-phosphate pyrophosphokinase [Candidatus Shapirobacteria bacterium]
MGGLRLIAGSASQELAVKISNLLKIPLTPIEDKRFSNGEIYIRVKSKVRGDDVYVIQSLSGPVNDNLMELLIIIDALKRASVGRINLICPILGYSRQDRKIESREPITAKLVADLISVAGANRIVTVDLHADQIQGFYNIPVDHFLGYPLFARYIKKHYGKKNLVIVSPDVGGVKRANKLADLLDLKIAIIDKVRSEHNKCEVMHLVGEVKDKVAVIIDDMIDTGGSICKAAEAVKANGAKEVIICGTHALLSGEALKNLSESCATKIILTDTVEIPGEKIISKMEIISVAPLLAKIIKRIHLDRSLGELFTWEDKRRVL